MPALTQLSVHPWVAAGGCVCVGGGSLWMWIPNFAAADPGPTCCRRAGRCSSRLQGNGGEHQSRRLCERAPLG